MREDVRKLNTEHMQMVKQKESTQQLVGMLEREKKRLENELKRYTKQEMKSAIIEAELH